MSFIIEDFLFETQIILWIFIFLIFRIWPAVLRQATYGTIKFGTYYILDDRIYQHFIEQNAFAPILTF